MGFCKKCGNEIEEGKSFCPECEEKENKKSNIQKITDFCVAAYKKCEGEIDNRFYLIFHKAIFTFFAIILFIIASHILNKLKKYGLVIASIRSVGGETLQEAYYQHVGYVFIYLAGLLKCIVAGISGIILCIAYKK